MNGATVGVAAQAVNIQSRSGGANVTVKRESVVIGVTTGGARVSLTVSRPNVVLALSGPRGAPGRNGGPLGDALYEAAVDVSGERVVYLDALSQLRYADSADIAHAYQVAGISMQAGMVGEFINVRSSGPYEFSGWNWTPNKPVFVGANGALTQTPPVSGVLIIVGVALSQTTLFIRIGRPVRRN